MKLTYRKSKNIEDLRDKPVGPKGVLVETKAKKKAEGIARQTIKGRSSAATKETKPIKNADLRDHTYDNTYNINVNTNNRRIGKFGDKLGVIVKNEDLDSKPTTFKKVKKNGKS